MNRGNAATLLALVAALSSSDGDSAQAAPAVDPPTPATVAAATLPPLANVAWLERLELPDGPAFVTPPVGAREPRPLIVAAHGAGDRPEWACGGWRIAVSEYAFVVCPEGLPMDARRFAWSTARVLALRVKQAIEAVRARFGVYVAPDPPLYVGFSQGATLAGAALLETTFPRVALAEGGYDLMQDAAFLARLRANGTERVLVVCGSSNCFMTEKSVERNFARAKIALLAAGDVRSGHNLNQRMQEALRAAWPDFVVGLPAWSGFPEYLRLRVPP